MTQKQSLLNIIIGSVVIAVVGSFVRNSAHNLGAFEFAAGLFIIAFVVLLFLTSFLPARTTAQAAQPARPQKRAKREKVPDNQTEKNSRRGGRARTNRNENRQPRRENQGKDRSSVSSNNKPQPAGNEKPNLTQENFPPDDIGNSNVLHGTIKWYNGRKGFGFVQFEEEEIFFHRNEVQSPGHKLRDGTKVSFVKGDSAKGPQAIHLKILEEA